MSEAESTQYIAHRLAVAGHHGTLPFDKSALKRIHRLARGVPRRINLLCGRALLGAWANGLQRVDGKVVEKAAAEVFGAEPERAPGVWHRPASYALGGLALSATVLLMGLALWSDWHKASVSEQAKPSVPPVAAASVAQRASIASPAARAMIEAPSGDKARLAMPLEALESLLTQLPTDANAAWRGLAPLWQLPASQDASGVDPCLAAAAQHLLCYRASNLTLPMLRQLGRPGILTLKAPNDVPRYAVLVGLNERSATLRVTNELHQVALVALARLWRGDFATYWRAPAGYSAELRNGSGGPSVEQLARQLSQFDGSALASAAAGPQILDADLRERVRAFQRAQGLKPDGQPGPMTFMQLDRATGANAPRLQTQ